MSDFDLRKFLAEQKAPKEESIKEETIEEVEVNEEQVEETYHEGDDKHEEKEVHEGEDHGMEEGELNEFSPEVVAVGAPLVMSLVASAIGKIGFDKFMQGLAKLPQLKSNKKFQDFVSKYGSTFEEGEDHGMEEGKEKSEEEIKESTFKASINDILNS